MSCRDTTVVGHAEHAPSERGRQETSRASLCAVRRTVTAAGETGEGSGAALQAGGGHIIGKNYGAELFRWAHIVCFINYTSIKRE